MPEWMAILIAGGIGGFANALISRELTWVARHPRPTRHPVYDPGTPGTVCIGIIAGLVFWGLYDPTASFANVPTQVHPFIGAILAGIGGARLLETYVERTLDESAVDHTSDAIARLTARPSPARRPTTPRAWRRRR
jgi:hypothetical protein